MRDLGGFETGMDTKPTIRRIPSRATSRNAVEPHGRACEDPFMQARWPLLAGLALVSLAGCQSYYPYGYAGTGPYPSPPPGSFAPPQGGPTYIPPQSSLPPGYRQGPVTYGPPVQRGPGQTYIPPAQTYAPGGPMATSPSAPSPRQPVTSTPNSVTTTPAQVNEKPVPTPVEPRPIPERVGSAVLDEEADEIKGGSRDTGGTPRGSTGGGFPDDAEDAVDTIGSDDFPPPRSPIRRASGTAEASRRMRKSPYSHDSGYRRLSGTVAQDPQTGDWQLRYDPEGNDDYGGTVTLSHDEMLENLVEGDSIVVHGRLDESRPDRFGRPRYKADPNRIKWLVDPDER